MEIAKGTVRLRSVEEKDLSFLFQVYAGTRKEEMARTNWPADMIEKFLWNQFITQHNYYKDYYHNTSYQIIIADGKPAGRLYVSRWEKEMRVVDLALLEQFRGKGIGSFLLQELIDEAIQANLPLTIHVEKNNPALKLYLRLGFYVAEDRGVYHFLQRDSKSKSIY